MYYFLNSSQYWEGDNTFKRAVLCRGNTIIKMQDLFSTQI